MSRSKIRAVGIVVATVAGMTIAQAPAIADNRAHFSSLNAVRIADDGKNGVDDHDECYYPLPYTYCIGDGHVDDLRVTFTETHIRRNSGVDIEVTATRHVEATCVSAIGELFVSDSGPIKTKKSLEGENPASPEVHFTHDGGVRSVSGAVTLRTNFKDDSYDPKTDPAHEAPVCPRYDPRSETVIEFHLVKDYTVRYTDVTVTDHANGDATRTEPLNLTYHHEVYGGFTIRMFQGFQCTVVESDGSGNCHTP